MQRKPFTRRRFMATSAAVSASMIAAPFVRSARAAGSLTIGMWDHWVPGANDMQSAIIKEWADAEKVDVKIDYITSQGNKLMLTLAAEELAKSGHDIMEFTNWEAAQHADSLEPTDDVMKEVFKTPEGVSLGANFGVNSTFSQLSGFVELLSGFPRVHCPLCVGFRTHFHASSIRKL